MGKFEINLPIINTVPAIIPPIYAFQNTETPVQFVAQGSAGCVYGQDKNGGSPRRFSFQTIPAFPPHSVIICSFRLVFVSFVDILANTFAAGRILDPQSMKKDLKHLSCHKH
jgi:hypothetical protein